MRDEINLKNFIGKEVIIILSNQMRYTGLVLFIGDIYIKIKDKFNKEVLIVLDNICSVEEKI